MLSSTYGKVYFHEPYSAGERCLLDVTIYVTTSYIAKKG